MNCILCSALQNERDHILHQDAHVFILVNIEPIKEGHVMILPVRHAEQLRDLTPDESSAFLKAIDRAMLAIAEAYEETPMCLVNGWKYRTQPHLHAHVLPSKKNLRGLYAASEDLEERKRGNEQVILRIKEALLPFIRSDF